MKTTNQNNDPKIEKVPIVLPTDVVIKLAEVSEANHIGVQELILSYIEEGLLKAQPKQKQRNFIKNSEEILAQHNARIDKDVIAEKFTYRLH